MLAIVLAAALLAGCGDGGQEPATGGSPDPAASVPTAEATAVQASPSPAEAPSQQPTVIPDDPASTAGSGVLRIGTGGTLLASSPGGGPVGRLRAGVLVPFDRVEGDWARVTTPCALSRWMPLSSAARLAPARVVLDPGHGGDESGAVGPGGLQEKDVNLRVAKRAAELLNVEGVPTVLTRPQDYRATLEFRATLADTVDAAAFVSIHHNADPDGRMDRPGTETYYQYHSPESKRLAGLVYEEAVALLRDLPAQWVGDTDAGAKWRLNSRGIDYYGVLRRTAEAGVPSVLAELSFISNVSEEALLRRDDVIDREARAVVNGTLWFLRTEDPGSGFTTPYPRRAPAGPGGGTSGCVDPA